MCALPEYFVDISPNNSKDQVLIVGAQAEALSVIKLTKTI